MEEVKLLPNEDERIDPNIPTATLQIYNYIDELLGRKEKDTHINRASAANYCVKRRWYQGKGFEGEKLTPRKIVNFSLGDLTEHMVKYFIQKGCVGEGKTYSEVDFGKAVGTFTIQGGKEITIFEQEDLTARVGEIEVTSHVDGWGKRNADGVWELIEVKSAAGYGYDEFKENGPGDYLKQATVNMSTNKALELGARSVRFFYLKKDTGHIWDRLFQFDDELFKQVTHEYAVASGEQEPIAPFGPEEETFRTKPTGRLILKFPCNYCPYVAKCQPAFDIEFKSNRPVYVVKPQTKTA